MDAVSPELALVDPELAARARAALPFPSDCLASAEPLGPRPDTTRARSVPRPRRPSLLVALAALVAASLIGVPSGTAGSIWSAAGSLVHAVQQAGAAAMPG